MKLSEIEARQDEIYRMVAWLEKNGEMFFAQYQYERLAELDQYRGEEPEVQP